MKAVWGHLLIKASPFQGRCQCGTDIYGRPGDELSLLRAHRLHLSKVAEVARVVHPAGKGRRDHP